jgi:hypothetical protein
MIGPIFCPGWFNQTTIDEGSRFLFLACTKHFTCLRLRNRTCPPVPACPYPMCRTQDTCPEIGHVSNLCLTHAVMCPKVLDMQGAKTEL